MTVSQVDASKATDFEIKWTDGLNTFCSTNGAVTFTKGSEFNVYGKVGGKVVKIPTGDYEITGMSGDQKLDTITSTNPEKTVEGTLTVTVKTVDDNNKNVATEVTAKFNNSNADPKIASIKVKSAVSSVGTTVDIDNIVTAAFDVKDQYGKPIGNSGIVATIVILNATNTNADVEYNGTTKAEMKNATAGDKISVTLTKGDITVTKELTI